MFSKINRLIVLILVVVFSLTVPMGYAFADTGDSATIADKSEIVYAKLSTSGQVSTAYVVNRFVLSTAGSVTDYGSYGSVVNLTDTRSLHQEADSVTFDAPAGNFYYQGNIPLPELPWIFDVSYTLDGTAISAEALAGASGKLGIQITSNANEAVDTTFYDNYLLQISITLDSETCTDIDSEGATVAIAGTNMVLNHTILPGKDADIEVSAIVQDFEMQGIDISAIPYSMDFDLPDTDNMVDDFEQLSDAISKLNRGVGDLADGVASMRTGAKSLEKGSSDINSGLEQLSTNGTQIVTASEQINTSLAQISAMLNGGAGSSFSLSELAALPSGLSQLAQGISDISSGLSQLETGFVSAFQALDAAMQSIPASSITEAQITELYSNTDASQHGVLDELVATYTAAQTAKGTYNSVKDAFSAMEPTMDTLIANLDVLADTLNNMSSDIEDALAAGDLDQLDQLVAGLTALSQNYSDFNAGLGAYAGGVSDISTGYAKFHKGLARFFDGIDDLNSGVQELYSGTKRLKSETSDMPDTLQSEIDDMLGEYGGTDFTPVSFTSSKNTDIQLVQFVFKFDGITKPDSDDTVATTPEEETVWDRLTSLFEDK